MNQFENKTKLKTSGYLFPDGLSKGILFEFCEKWDDLPLTKNMSAT